MWIEFNGKFARIQWQISSKETVLAQRIRIYEVMRVPSRGLFGSRTRVLFIKTALAIGGVRKSSLPIKSAEC